MRPSAREYRGLFDAVKASDDRIMSPAAVVASVGFASFR